MMGMASSIKSEVDQELIRTSQSRLEHRHRALIFTITHHPRHINSAIFHPSRIVITASASRRADKQQRHEYSAEPTARRHGGHRSVWKSCTADA